MGKNALEFSLRSLSLVGIAHTSSVLSGVFLTSGPSPFFSLPVKVLMVLLSLVLQVWLWQLNAEGAVAGARTRCGARRSGPGRRRASAGLAMAGS